MIRYNQIKSLTKISEFDGTIAGFLFNFRDEKNQTERTYFQDIKDFNKMLKKINKKSFDEIDLSLNNAVKITGEKKRVHYKWNIDDFMKSRCKDN